MIFATGCSGVKVMLRVLQAALLLGASVVIQADDSDNPRCYVICSQICSSENPSYNPQRCDDCCGTARRRQEREESRSEERECERSGPVREEVRSEKSGARKDYNNLETGSRVHQNDRLAAMETAVSELRVMTGVLLVLVLLLFVAMVGLFLYFTNSLPKFRLPVLFKNKCDTKEVTNKPCNGVDHNSTVVRIANYQSNHHSPRTNRSSVNMSSKGPTEDIVNPPEFQPRPLRVRQPSESTCPDESSDLPQHAYDNLALSTSTLHNTSTDTLSAAVSTSTLETTLPSGNHLQSTNGETVIV
nr:uncharacterized protein LOC128701617 isoform X1 [Cherax quadricarinatus]XP_053651431.1 uncharacterized protein LOC128701617 isoform X1 [Cherax quadricarinatus]XP_053651440.1 uncharacterized protein LOC128701617 isoform X1 [Cherax quadricarinatus]XP_053651450.1 uncharacterized protein LOC128701617 isoform X1 [Cherax quadricarinatus]XP_053651459.1 uncharacterized protein LOC128701617 isoform X1 [Cherax quadricarinatus]XP_053651469.1 uncharacterized protein LOC128701617 isoform X1 [Cherax quad